MSCDCAQATAKTEAERKTLRIALSLNTTMFVVGITAGWLAQSTGLMADALDMLTDAVAYALALMAISRGPDFKRNAARWTGGVLVLLGTGIVAEVVRRWFHGSEPVGLVMMAYSAVSFGVNLFVLTQLAKYRQGQVHINATYICTRADVIANIGVFVSGTIVTLTGLRVVDLVAGFAIGLYVVKEAIEILREAAEE
ncbi:MAG: cation transporter [Xanthomonadales bacterium PRO7]|jgi:Co/Zn/Cd efflux system component|nr:cation transporter [Xanthomonadales bacterium PRO7]